MLTALLLAALTVVSPVSSSEPEPQDGVVATAPATPLVLEGAVEPVGAGGQTVQPHGLTTDEQIARWLAARSVETEPRSESPVWRDDRQLHGEFNIAAGTGGYRDYSAAVSLPLGESGRLDLSVRQIENGYPYRYGYGATYDPYFDDSGYVFPGLSRPGAALDYERHLSRPDGTPNRRPRPRPQEPAAE